MLFPIPAVMELIEPHFRMRTLASLCRWYREVPWEGPWVTQSSSPAVVAVTTSSQRGPEHDGTMFSFIIDSATNKWSSVVALPQAENLSPC